MIELLDGLYAGLAEPDNSGGGSANKKKYGITIDAMLGDTSAEGMLTLPNVHDECNIAGVKSIASQALRCRFMNTGVSAFIAPDLETINTASACEDAFFNAFVSTVSWPKLKTIGGSRSMYRMFRGCPMTSLTIPAQTIAGGYCCQGLLSACPNLETVYFPNLSDVGSVVTQFRDMLLDSTGVTVHFPSAMQSTMENWADVTSGFSGTNTTVLFDL